MLIMTLANIIGAIILIAIILPWFLIGVFVVSILYTYAAAFYRSSARELKVRYNIRTIFLHLIMRPFFLQRLDAVLRSSLYSHFSESLTGLTTIRAYGESGRFRLENEKVVNVENRAYWLTVTNQVLYFEMDFMNNGGAHFGR
jgi:ABC-type multidrug transport system fused ATPase/permease subunit